MNDDLSKLKLLACRLRIALRQVFDRSSMMLTDSGDSSIHAIASEALNLYESDTIDEHIARLEAVISRCNQLNTLQPISTAPRDGTYVLLFGDSGHSTAPFRCEVCRYDAAYRKLQPWLNHWNDSFEDCGAPATHWLPIPKYKA